jgi:uncharacterized protein
MDLSPCIELFLLGLSGTGHCIGMCGPLVIAFPGQTTKPYPHLCYHTGRVFTYTTIGILMGSFGLAMTTIASLVGFDHLATIARIQLLFSLLAGMFLFIFGLGQLGIVKQPGWLTISSPDKIPGYRHLIRSALHKTDPARMLITGMFMGFLPCGLSFAAFSRALAASRPLEGGLLLLAFGLGTFPGLLLIGTGASVLSRRYRQHFNLLSGILMIWMAASLLIDGITAIF